MNPIQTLLTEESPDPARMAQLKRSREDNLNILSWLDAEILELTEDADIENEMQEADNNVQEVIIQLDQLLQLSRLQLHCL